MAQQRSAYDRTASRRDVLRTVALVSAGGVGPGTVGARGESGKEDEPGRVEDALGTFDGGLDGWKGAGGVELARVPRADRPFAVGSGTHGLVAAANGDGVPTLTNRSRVGEADWRGRRYLLADVTPGGDAAYDSPVAVTLRLHSDVSAPEVTRDAARLGSDGSEPSALAVASYREELIPFRRGRIAWDLRDVDDATLRDVKRLDVSWYPTGQLAEGGPDGDESGNGGELTIGRVGLAEDEETAARARLRKEWLELAASHGRHVDTAVAASSEGFQRGAFVFADGAEVAYEYEEHPDGAVLTVDGHTYRLGGSSS